MIREWMTLLRLARRRFRSSDDYLRFQIYQGNLILDYLAEQGICIQSDQVLDLASYTGGYGQAMTNAGARVISTDLKRPRIIPPDFVLADAIQLPFDSNRFSLVFCASLIEHVPEPIQLLLEIKRVLTPDGVAYLSFPPFYTPIGGHQFKPYHLLGERWAIRLSGKKVDSFATACGDWGIYPLTIRRVRQLIADAQLQVRHESTRYLPFNLARLPWLGEFLTWHVQFILGKKDRDSSVSELGGLLEGK
ncbi:MAG: class I SAM-dependent methyltransferase [Chloroflexi bacterium]|nr:class I SAM-dependent methyltransferase [Chloroflexota bacterium]